MQVKKQQLELDMEQRIGSKLGKEYVKAVYCHAAYLTSLQSAVLCCAELLSPIQLFAIPGTVAHQAPLSMGNSPGKDIRVGCHALLQGILPT